MKSIGRSARGLNQAKLTPIWSALLDTSSSANCSWPKRWKTAIPHRLVRLRAYELGARLRRAAGGASRCTSTACAGRNLLRGAPPGLESFPAAAPSGAKANGSLGVRRFVGRGLGPGDRPTRS